MPELAWRNRHSLGFLEIVPREYDEPYFDKYVGYENTDMGKILTHERIQFVNNHHEGDLLDVGIGSGHFVASRPNTYGFDINPKGVAWLKERGLFRDPSEQLPAYSFFDSFEHIKDPSPMLDSMKSGTLLFISIPIFNDSEHVKRSKHFRPDEHYWYFTAVGFIRYMAKHRFTLIDIDDFETRLGREDIKSFAFVKAQVNGRYF
jgi:hypothetical protein